MSRGFDLIGFIVRPSQFIHYFIRDDLKFLARILKLQTLSYGKLNFIMTCDCIRVNSFTNSSTTINTGICFKYIDTFGNTEVEPYSFQEANCLKVIMHLT